MAPQDPRFTIPLYTAREAAWMLGVKAATFHDWVHGRPGHEGRQSRPVVTAVAARPGQPSIPFIGLAESMVAAAFRRASVSMQHIRKSLLVLEAEIGLEHALASRRLYTDGAKILYDYAHEHDDRELLATVLTGQHVFVEIIREYLRRVEFDTDTWAIRLVLPITERPLVVVDPARGFGQPLFLKGGAPVESVLERFRAGEPLRSVAEDFDLAPADVEDMIRAALPAAA